MRSEEVKERSGEMKIYAVVGPTASGKSALALELARRHGGEIISCDSMQIYKSMDIGTAKPTPEEMRLVPHHMIDVVEPTDSFSCADYVEMADAIVRDVVSRGKIPIFCGGTGLYLDSLLRGKNFEDGLTNDSLRAELLDYAARYGADALHDRLASIDPESALAIHKNNVKRVARAIEIYELSGMPKSEIDRRSREEAPRFEISAIGLNYSDRDELYRRIDARVDIMMSEGLEAETRALYEAGVFEVNSTAAQAIGYKELLPYIKGEEELGAAIDKLKMATRRYAKRQITWFSARSYVTPLDVCTFYGKKTFEEIVNIAESLFFN